MSLSEPRDPDDGRFLLPGLLEWVADQVRERMRLVCRDDARRTGHPYRAVCGYNASLGIEWGCPSELSVSEGPPAEHETKWSANYADPSVVTQFLDVLLHGEPIHRITIASVDGHRCWIPYPEQTPNGYRVTTWELSIVGLANGLVRGSTDSIDYVRIAGIETINRPPSE